MGWAGASDRQSHPWTEMRPISYTNWALFPLLLHCVNWTNFDDLRVDHYADFVTFHRGYFWYCFRDHQEEWNNGTWMLNIFCSVLCRKSLTCFSIGNALTSLLTWYERATIFQRQEINIIYLVISFSYHYTEHKLSLNSICLNNTVKRDREKGIHLLYMAANGLCTPLILKYSKPGELFWVSNCNQVDGNSLPNNKLIYLGMIHLLPLPIMVIEYSSHNKCS